MRAAYAAQPVQQPDGSTLLLCWNGRIARGYERLAATGGKERPKSRRSRRQSAAWKRSTTAAAVAAERLPRLIWAAIAAAAGVTVGAQEVYPPECQCEGCRMQRAYHDPKQTRGVQRCSLRCWPQTRLRRRPSWRCWARLQTRRENDRLWTMERITRRRATIRRCGPRSARPTGGRPCGRAVRNGGTIWPARGAALSPAKYTDVLLPVMAGMLKGRTHILDPLR